MDVPEFPASTPEYDAYRAELRVELDKFVAGDAPYEYEDPPADPGAVVVTNSADGPLPCIVKVSGQRGLELCGEPTEFLTAARALAKGMLYSGWYHRDIALTAHHHAVPRSWV